MHLRKLRDVFEPEDLILLICHKMVERVVDLDDWQEVNEFLALAYADDPDKKTEFVRMCISIAREIREYRMDDGYWLRSEREAPAHATRTNRY